MARFYKTASANPLDYMYRINVPLIRDVIAANDQYITQNLNQTQQLGILASSFPYLQADEDRAREIVNQYSSQVDDITRAIRQDPANWRKQLDPIRNLSSDLQRNMRVGEISKISGNYAQYKTVSDFIDKEVENYGKTGKGISADRAKAYKDFFLKNFQSGTQYNPETGEYNLIKVSQPMGNIDIRKTLSEELDKLKADKTSYKEDSVTGQEWYFNRRTEQWEGITPEKILGIVTDRLNNPQLVDYLRQDTQVGLVSGVFDDEGKFIAPYNYKGVDISSQEKATIDSVRQQIAKSNNPNQRNQLQARLTKYENELKNRKQLDWNEESYLAPILRGIANQYSYGQTTQEELLRNNSKGSTLFNQAQQNARHAASLAQQKELAEMRERGVNDRSKQNLDFQRYKWDNPHETGKRASTAKKAKDKKDEKAPIESSVSRLNTNSFEDWMTEDRTTRMPVKVLSNAGLSSDIDRLKTEENDAQSEIGTLDSNMKSLIGNRRFDDLSMAEKSAYNTMKVKKESLESNLSKISSDLNQRRAWYKTSIDAALSNNVSSRKDSEGDIASELTAEEIALYKKYEGTKYNQAKKKVSDVYAASDAANKKWKDLQSKYPNTPMEQIPGFTEAIEANKAINARTGEIKSLDRELQNYINVKNKVDQRRENFLSQMRYTPIDTDAIQLGTEDSKAVATMLFSNPQGLKLYDNTGNKTDHLSLEGKGISWLNPTGDNYNMSTADNSLINYMNRYNVEPVVEQVGNTTKIGTGNAVIKVTFKDPTGQIPKTPFYVEVTPELQRQIGTRLSKDKNPEVQKIANNLLDDEANEIRRQLITPTAQRTAGKRGTDPATFTIYINNGNRKIPFQVTKFVAEDDQVHLDITGSVGGTQVPLPNTPSGMPGWFNGPDEFINYIKSQRNR